MKLGLISPLSCDLHVLSFLFIFLLLLLALTLSTLISDSSNQPNFRIWQRFSFHTPVILNSPHLFL